MDYRAIFAISASGMQVEKTRLDVTAANLANIHSGRDASGKLYQPMRVVSAAGAPFAQRFAAGLGGMVPAGARVLALEPQDGAPRQVYEPGSPEADARGMVERPGINHLSEMVALSSALRAYQANVAAFNAGKHMALKALELGGGQ